MNERQARQAGYSFTGCYSHDKEEMKARAKEERAKGNKAIVVNVPTSKLSRGYHGMGYSVYFIESEENKEQKRLEIKANRIKNLERKLAEAELEVVEIKAELEGLKNA